MFKDHFLLHVFIFCLEFDDIVCRYAEIKPWRVYRTRTSIVYWALCHFSSLGTKYAFTITYGNVRPIRSIARFNGEGVLEILHCNKSVITWPLGHLADLSHSGTSRPRVINQPAPSWPCYNYYIITEWMKLNVRRMTFVHIRSSDEGLHVIWEESLVKTFTSSCCTREDVSFPVSAFVCLYVRDIKNGHLIGQCKHVTTLPWAQWSCLRVERGPSTALNTESKSIPACVQPEQLPFTNTEHWTGYRPPIHAARAIYHRAEQRINSTLPRECRKSGRPNLRSCLLRSSCWQPGLRLLPLPPLTSRTTGQ